MIFSAYSSFFFIPSHLAFYGFPKQIKSAAAEATAPKIASLDCCDTTHPMTGMKETDVFAKHRYCHR